jgi:hypothetical protein
MSGSTRPLLITLVAVTAVLVIGAAAVLMTLLLGPRPAAAIASPTRTPTAVSGAPTPTPTPAPTVTVLVGPPASTALAITGFTITPTPVDCGSTASATTVPLHARWTSTGATRATFSINGTALPGNLPASGTEANIIHNYPSFSYSCQAAYEMYTLTVFNGAHSAAQTIFVAREFANLH